MNPATPFTGRNRRRQTRRSVRIVDRVARSLIAAGGIGTVVAVSTVCLFLVWIALPLFLPATILAEHSIDVPAPASTALHTEIDDYRTLAWVISDAGELRSVRLDSGVVIAETSLFPEAPPTAWSFGVGGREAVCGFADGSVRTVKLGFSTTFPAESTLSDELRSLKVKEFAEHDGGLLTRAKQGQLRLQTVRGRASEPIVKPTGDAVACVDSSSRTSGRISAVLDVADHLIVHAEYRRQNLLREATESRRIDVALPYAKPADGVRPRYLLLAGQGDNLYLVWEDGRLQRYDLRDLAEPRLAEELDLIPEPDQRVTTVQFLPGKTTFAVGDSLGRVRAWFPARPADARTVDGVALVAAHDLATGGAAVSSLASAARARLLAVGYEDGDVRIFQVTSNRPVVEISSHEASPARLVTIAPKGDGVLRVADDRFTQWPLAMGYPEVSWSSLFHSVWYEGYDAPRHIWQSSGGSDDFEPKLGMIPLVFGTLKATVYSLLFAVPLALLSAIFSSEFLHPRVKMRVKPAIEMMASLPSVVLGFVAALVVAPYVEQVIPAIIAALVVVPFTYLLAAHLWQLLPPRIGLLLERWRFLFICATLPVGAFLAAKIGPLVEQFLFAGDLHAWLDGQAGSGVGGWFVLFLPLSAVATALFVARRVNPHLRQTLRGAGRGKRALVELAKFLTAATVTCTGALGLALLLDSLDFDPRGVVLNTYVQRNALVVGFVMGFAVIPLIYTIADDALSTVPGHLRSASLGAGATPWQTAVRVIIPTAMSGLFSAVMIGLGRAVGETMIVLMAAGNTPIMDWNIFNGFQTLSASIATELPEAVQGSAHYRTLFVAALALFAITFVVNSVAEAVRLRFRRRAYEL